MLRRTAGHLLRGLAHPGRGGFSLAPPTHGPLFDIAQRSAGARGAQICVSDEGGGGGSDSFLCRRDALVGVQLRGFCRGYAATWHNPRHQRGAGGRGDGGNDAPSRQERGPSLQAEVNKQIKVAQSVDVVLQLVDEHGGQFNFVKRSNLSQRAHQACYRCGETRSIPSAGGRYVQRGQTVYKAHRVGQGAPR